MASLNPQTTPERAGSVRARWIAIAAVVAVVAIVVALIAIYGGGGGGSGPGY